MLPRVRCVLCLAQYVFIPEIPFLREHALIHPFVLLRLACDVRLVTMAALDGEPFHSMVHVVTACWGGGVSSELIGLRMFYVFGNDMKTVRETRQCLCCIDRNENEEGEMTAGGSSCHQPPVEMLLRGSHSHPIRILGGGG